MNRKTRLFALAEALRARRTGVTAEALAERFGVTVRTIYRDLATLQAYSPTCKLTMCCLLMRFTV